MNRVRRKQIAALLALVDVLQSDAEALAEAIESLRDDEQEAFDAMPDSVQSASKGDLALQAIDALDEAHDTASDAAILCGESRAALETARDVR